MYTPLTNITLSLEAKDIMELYNKDIGNLGDLKQYEFDRRYVCDKNGQVYKIKGMKSGKTLAVTINPYLTRDNYVEYVLVDKFNRKKHINAHRIVAGLFLKEVPGKFYVNHKDGNRQNNHVDNLEYVTHSENIKHSWDYLRKRK